MITLFLKKDKVQDLNINQLKLEVHDTYKKDEKITTDFEPTEIDEQINRKSNDQSMT